MIKVLYFASLREEIGRPSDEINTQEPITVEQLWQQATAQAQLPEQLLIAINQEYSDKNATVNAGDEVAFFPPVTGG